ncbi:MAG: hypothetical protein Phyf2KO_05020 [Phycisphaerales bacterium]
MIKSIALLISLAMLGGCCGGFVCEYPGSGAHAPGSINHVVFFDLIDPSDSDELVEDCYELLKIPGASSGYAGTHYDIGRASVLQDYDVGFFVAFYSEENYRAYVEHPAHTALVEKWKPRWESISVYDIGDRRTLERQSNQ